VKCLPKSSCLEQDQVLKVIAQPLVKIYFQQIGSYAACAKKMITVHCYIQAILESAQMDINPWPHRLIGTKSEQCSNEYQLNKIG